MNQGNIFKALKYVPLGGLIFWAPSVLLHWLRGSRFSRSDAIGLTVVLPISTILLFIVGRKISGEAKNRAPEILFALLGVWLFGPLMMSVSQTFGGGGFSKPDGWHFVLLGTSLFPVFTFMLSTYDGTLGALLLTTALLLSFAAKRNGPIAR